MPANFPTSLPAQTTTYATGDTVNAANQNNPNLEINAIGAKVGIDASAVTTSHDYKLSGVTGTDKAVSKTGVETLTNKTLTSPVVNTPTGIVKGDVVLDNVDNTSNTTERAATATLTNKTLTSPVINTPTGIVKADVGLGNVDNTSNATERAATATLTNKRIEPRIVSAASYTTDTGTSLDVSTTDIFVITAQAGALLFNSPGGTPVQGQRLVIRIKDNGTARALTWNAVFRAMGTALPSTTVLSKTLYLGFFYNSTDSKFDLVASAQEA